MSYTYLEYAHLPAGRRSRLAALAQRSAGRLAILDLEEPADGAGTSVDARDPHDAFRLATEARFSAVASSPGIAHTYLPDYAELLPLVLDLNGPFATGRGVDGGYALRATVEDALRLNAQAVRFTLDLEGDDARSQLDEFRALLAEAHRFELPVILRAPAARVRRLVAPGIDRATSLMNVALHHGADMLEVSAADLAVNAPETKGRPTLAACVSATVPVLARLAAPAESDAVLRETRAALDLGCLGLVVGAPVLGPSYPEALTLGRSLHEELAA